MLTLYASCSGFSKVAYVTTGKTDSGFDSDLGDDADLGDDVRLDCVPQTSAMSFLRTASHHAMTTLRVWAKLERNDLDFNFRSVWRR